MSYNITLLTDWQHVVNHSITKKAVFFFSLSSCFLSKSKKVFFHFLDKYSQKQRLLLVNVTYDCVDFQSSLVPFAEVCLCNEQSV